MKFYKMPGIVQKMFPKVIWSVPVLPGEKKLYLTFDDGPHPEITVRILDELKKYNAKATFFCVGANVEKFPETFARLKLEGHSIGNHTFNHMSGWTNSHTKYYANIGKCQTLTKTNLFRPPYGRLKFTQYRQLSKHYKVVMWDILSYDFDRKLDVKQALEKIIEKTEPGSVIVFHDSERAKENVLYMLPLILKHFDELGYQFEGLLQKIN